MEPNPIFSLGVLSFSTGDIVLFVTTFILASAALFVPYLAELLKRRWFAANLSIGFDLHPPDCHLTREEMADGSLSGPVFYFRFRVLNEGHSQARRCEAVVEKLSVLDAGGRFSPLPRFTPVNLVWGSGYPTEFVDINPGRRFYCDLCHISSPKMQSTIQEARGYVDHPPEGAFPVGVILNVKTAFFSQPNRLSPGKYLLNVSLYSENAKTVRKTFTVSWTGKWATTEELMFREAVVDLSA